MDDTQRLAAIEDIRQIKAKYWRGVDMQDDALVRSILAEDCVLDYMGCCTDPVTGTDHMPAMNMVMKGRESWNTANLDGPKTVTVHQGHQAEIDITSDDDAKAIWYFTDRFFLPPGGPFTRLLGFGRYHDTYVRADDGWKLKTTRIERYWVEVG